MFEYNVLKFFESLRNPILDKIFIFITNLGSFEFYLFSIAFLFFICNNRTSLKILFLLVISFSINTLIKNILKLPRPDEEVFNPIYKESSQGYGFPSGHSQNATSFWITISKNFKKKSILIFSIIIIFLISISRLYLSLHFLLDVLGGILIGIFIVYLFFDLIDIFLDNLMKIKFNFIFFLSLLIFGVFSKNYSNLFIPLSGIIFGFLLKKEESKINLNFEKILIRELIGLAVLIILIYISIQIKNFIFLTIIYFISGLWISYLSKFLFSKINV
jgi:membrane-associated phospholipid phosphatase